MAPLSPTRPHAHRTASPARAGFNKLLWCSYAAINARPAVQSDSAIPRFPSAHAATVMGSSWFDRSSPWPRQPRLPWPHAKRAPSAVRARLWQSPADTTTTLAREGLDLLWQQLALLVAVAQPAKESTAPAPGGAVGGDGEAVAASSRHSDDALPSEGLDLLRLPLG